MSERKLPAAVKVACILLGLLSGCAMQAERKFIETQGRVVWKGQTRETKGSSRVGMRASASHQVVEDGVKVLVDGSSEPMLYTAWSGSNRLSQLTIGDRVHVTLSERYYLFGPEQRVVAISKLEHAP